MKSATIQNLGLLFLFCILQSEVVNAKEKNQNKNKNKNKNKDKNKDKNKNKDKGENNSGNNNGNNNENPNPPALDLGRPSVNLGNFNNNNSNSNSNSNNNNSGNNNNNNNNNEEETGNSNASLADTIVSVQDESLNPVMVPQCNPSNSDSFYSQSKRPENRGRTDFLEDTINDCDEYLQYCDKKRSNVEMSWPNFVFADEFYDTVEVLYDRCFKSCVEYLPGGIDEFCSMPEPQPIQTISSAKDYCETVEDRDWSAEMIAHEADVLEALNRKRDEAGGIVCARNTNNGVSQTFFPRRSPVTTNPSLQCAARIQAKNIVKATIEANRFPGNLHSACPKDDFGGGKPICEDFSTRMKNSGYTYHENGFGFISEVTAAGYRSADSVIDGWLDSRSGHCSAIVKQESLVVTTEVGIGYYRDEETGRTGHVMLLGQRQL